MHAESNRKRKNVNERKQAEIPANGKREDRSLRLINSKQSTTSTKLPHQATSSLIMIFLRSSTPDTYNPYSGHLYRPKVYLWHSSPESHAPTGLSPDHHVDKKPKNGKPDVPQQQIAPKVENNDEPNVIFHARNAEVTENDNALVMSVDLPGVKSTDLNIEVEKGVLSIVAERKSSTGNSAKMVKQFFINDQKIDGGKLEANLTDGVLTITLPKKEETKPVAIPLVKQAPPEMEGDNVVQFTCDLPGVKVNDIKLEFHERTFTLHAKRQRGQNTSKIDKQFVVDSSNVDTESLKAYLADGVLTITAVRKEALKQVVSVSSGALPVATSNQSDDSKDDDGVLVETVNNEDDD